MHVQRDALSKDLSKNTWKVIGGVNANMNPFALSVMSGTFAAASSVWRESGVFETTSFSSLVAAHPEASFRRFISQMCRGLNRETYPIFEKIVKQSDLIGPRVFSLLIYP